LLIFTKQMKHTFDNTVCHCPLESTRTAQRPISDRSSPTERHSIPWPDVTDRHRTTALSTLSAEFTLPDINISKNRSMAVP
jgi:hypothetical protein